MIKGLTITVPIIGRIAIGSTYKSGDRLLPQADDHFTITRQTKQDGVWDLHPLNKTCLERQTERFVKAKADAMTAAGASQEEIDAAVADVKDKIRLREIPVRLMFDDPDLNFRAEYGAFEKSGRPVCAGDGSKFTRREGCQKKCGECSTPDFCDFGKSARCKPYARLNVQVEGQTDELGAFIFRTTGWNSIRTITARLLALKSLAGGNLAGIPLVLKMEAKSTSKSHGAPVYYVDLRIRDGFTLVQAIAEGKKYRQVWEDAGISRVEFERAVKEGLANGIFEDTEEDGEVIISEFFPELNEEGGEGGDASKPAQASGKRQAAKTSRATGTAASPGIEAFQESLAMVSQAYQEGKPGEVAPPDGAAAALTDQTASVPAEVVAAANGSAALLNQPAAGSA